MAPIDDPLLITQAVFHALNLPDVSSRWSLSALSAYLRDRRALLVLDNCEHLLDGAAGLAATLLRSCPELRVLATSRQALGMAGEVRFVVPPLSLPDPAESPSPGRSPVSTRSPCSWSGLPPQDPRQWQPIESLGDARALSRPDHDDHDPSARAVRDPHRGQVRRASFGAARGRSAARCRRPAEGGGLTLDRHLRRGLGGRLLQGLVGGLVHFGIAPELLQFRGDDGGLVRASQDADRGLA
jgi:hypothetical protein